MMTPVPGVGDVPYPRPRLMRPPKLADQLCRYSFPLSQCRNQAAWKAPLRDLPRHGLGSETTQIYSSASIGEQMFMYKESTRLQVESAKVLSQVTCCHKIHLKVVCRLALAIWSYWYGCRERIFLNIAKASNPLETP